MDYPLTMATQGLRNLVFFVLCFISHCDVASAKTVTGCMSTVAAKATKGQYLTGFYFHGEAAQFQYEVNTTGRGGASLYLYLDEDWQEAKDTTDCLHRLKIARRVYELDNVTSASHLVLHFARPRLWHVVYADSYTCSPGRPLSPLETPVWIRYSLTLLNPDTLGNPTDHFGGDVSGLFRFYQLLTLAYFILGCIYIPRISETLQKGGPMHLVIRLLSAATCLQAVGVLAMLVHLRRFSYDGVGAPMFELLAELLDLMSHFVMLYMLSSLALGWTLTQAYKPSVSHGRLEDKPTAGIIGLIGVLQCGLFLWEQYEQQEQRSYHAHRSLAGVALALVRLVLAAVFVAHLRGTVCSERSRLKRDFYNSFTKCCMVWFLSSPLLVLISVLLSPYLRFKVITMGVVVGQCTAVFMLYRLFLSRALYWEVSALSSYLPLRMDKTFGLKQYS